MRLNRIKHECNVNLVLNLDMLFFILFLQNFIYTGNHRLRYIDNSILFWKDISFILIMESILNSAFFEEYISKLLQVSTLQSPTRWYDLSNKAYISFLSSSELDFVILLENSQRITVSIIHQNDCLSDMGKKI